MGLHGPCLKLMSKPRPLNALSDLNSTTSGPESVTVIGWLLDIRPNAPSHKRSKPKIVK